jgi:serine/threonine protein kinase
MQGALEEIQTVNSPDVFITETRERFKEYEGEQIKLADDLYDLKGVVKKAKRRKQEVTPAMKQAVQEAREGLARLSKQHWTWTQRMGSACSRFAAEFLCEGFYATVLRDTHPNVQQEDWYGPFMSMVHYEGLENVHRKLHQFSKVTPMQQQGVHELLLGEMDGQVFALKKFPASEKKQMLHESMVLKSLQHVYIGDVVCFFQDEYKGMECYYMQMPFYGGGTLQQRIEGKEWFQSFPLIRHVCAQLLRALKYLHGRNVAHGDIKPSNIFFTDVEEGKLPMTKLGDLGASDASANMTMVLPIHTTVVRHVTQNYAPPELTADPTAPKTPASDMYSLGLVMFDLVFSSQHRNNGVLGALQLLEDAESEDMPHCPQLAALLRLLLVEDPAQRITAAAACDHPFFVVGNAEAVHSALHKLQTRGEPVKCSSCREERYATECTGCNSDAKEGQHWLCHVQSEKGGETCFDSFILNCLADNTVAEAGLPCCMAPACGGIFPEASFRVRVRSTHVWAAYSQARVKHIESVVNRDKEGEIKRALEAHAKLDKHSRAVREYQIHIEERILTSCCPNSHPFVDFVGCFALSCSQCDAHFCAYCLADCGNSQGAHAHIAAKNSNDPDDWTCPMKKTVRAGTGNQNAYFGSDEEYEMATKLRVTAKLKDFLPSVPIETLGDVLDACREQIIAILGQGELDKLLRKMGLF